MLKKRPIILILIGVFVSSIIYVSYDIHMHSIRPFEGTAQHHIGELKKFPQIAAFYEKYSNEKISVSEVSDSAYRPVFTIQHENKILNMHVEFYNEKPSKITFVCSDLDASQRLLFKTDSLEKECFE